MVRARIVLAAADGVPNAVIARMLSLSEDTVRAWRGRFIDGGITGLAAAGQGGLHGTARRCICSRAGGRREDQQTHRGRAVSQRETIESHLARIYDKPGVHSRAALTTVIVRESTR